MKKDIISINQPSYLPWLGYFHRIWLSDVHVVLDHVQFEKNSFINRNKIRAKEGFSWLTVPILTKGKFGDLPINQLEIASGINWARKHKTSIMLNYRKAPFFDKYFPYLESIYERRWTRFIDLVEGINTYLLSCLRINTKILYSSRLDVQGRKSGLVLNICLKTGASSYLSGSQGRNYLKEKEFHRQDISISYHDYEHPVYKQCYQGFEPCMSVIDLLFNHGEESADILKRPLAADKSEFAAAS